MSEIHTSPEMTEQSVFQRMRANLQPIGTGQIVGLSFKTGYSSSAYFKHEYVARCIDLLELRVALAAAGLDELNDLEKLAAQLLMNSAYIDLDKELDTGKCQFL